MLMLRALARLGTDLVWQIKCRHNPASDLSIRRSTPQMRVRRQAKEDGFRNA